MDQTGTIGIVGGGQLGRMLTEAALPLGFKVVVLNPAADSPASQVGAQEIVGGLYDAAALRQLAAQSDYLTVEIEHLNADILDALASDGKPVNPAPKTVRLIQDKLAQKQYLRQNGLPVADFVEITDEVSVVTALKAFGGKILLKTRLGAYDGRGNLVVSSKTEVHQAFEQFKGQKLYAEQFVPFVKELAVMAAKDLQGNVVTYPLTETIHERNICVETLTPASVSPEVVTKAEAVAAQAVEHLAGAGVFGIEMFLTEDGEVLINEIAPRVHNSGHYTIESCQTSQFEQHVRAITGLELGPVDLKVKAAVMVNILGERDGLTEVKGLAEAEAVPGVSIHLYGKSPTKVDRKMGHITAIGNDLDEARQRAERARELIDV